MEVNNMSKDRLGEMIFLKYHLIICMIEIFSLPLHIRN